MKVKYSSSCPYCGDTNFTRVDDGYECLACGYFVYAEDMVLTPIPAPDKATGEGHMTEYERYQLEWMIAHGYSLAKLMYELQEMQYEDPEDSDRISTPIHDLFEEFVQDRGFGSEIWACEAEWKEYWERNKND